MCIYDTYVVYVCASTQGAKWGRQTRSAVKGSPMQITSAGVWDHNLGGLPRDQAARNFLGAGKGNDPYGGVRAIDRARI